ncbi:hypothetical protein DFA_05405 [Cavenderia fasciculata]|uniref:Phospholipid/glycerol acyltransferase domain-containing protein n=1 Tax=Cavenderia fasciculata TaxID=261658 RepID=F4PL51_CACFS|nr:uncharacterized protein DFA_05405 [Cavenderia fasciculata]EGG23273.1 hypothetical protein DFA_05405 [Cavenderia fasciculata]|eukprot:XP_004361124.1 hypothetical protein DFA_05405 [Cavenderia fasciculata]
MSSSTSSSTSSSSSSSTVESSVGRIKKRYLHDYGKYSSVHTSPFKLWAEKWWRRTIAITMISIIFIILTALFPVLAVAALIADMALYHRRKGLNYVRVLSFFETYLFIQFIAMSSCFVIYIIYLLSLIVSGDKDKKRWNRWNYWYQRWWGGTMLFGWSTRILGLKPHIEVCGSRKTDPSFSDYVSNESTRDRIAQTLGVNPKIMFLRHASFADTLVPQGLLSNCGFAMRYIVKQELLWDPGLDISGSRTPNFFLFRDAGAEGMDVEMEAIRNLVRDFKKGGNEVTCIWPEGTRFTKSKREKVLESLKKKGDSKYELASKLKHTLLPRLGGALALLESNPCGDVVFCSHIGLEASSNFAQMMEGKLCNRDVKIKLLQYKYEDVPKTKEARINWMLENWAQIDQWVEDQLVAEKSSSKKKYGKAD